MVVESKYPILVLSYRNCELHCCHLDGYKNNTQAMRSRLGEIEAFFSGKPGSAQYRLWFNVDDTRLNRALMQEIVDSLLRVKIHIRKIAFIGLSGLQKLRFEKQLRLGLPRETLPHAYFGDAEKAKEWLV